MVKKLSNRGELLADRLAGILISLNSGRVLSVKELAREYRVSERTIQKDLNSRLMSLPIDNNTPGKYQLDASYLGKFQMDDMKLFAQVAGLKGLYPELNYQLMNRLLHPMNQEAIKVIGHNYENIDDRSEGFYRLEQFILKKQEIKFQYKDKEYRGVKPYKLINQDGIWYLAVETEDKKLKSFHFKKLKYLSGTGNTYQVDLEITKKIEESDSIWFEGEVQTIKLWVSANVAAYFKQRPIFPRQVIIEEQEDGSLILETITGNMKMLIPEILYWLPDILVIEPVSKKKEIEKLLSQYLYDHKEK